MLEDSCVFLGMILYSAYVANKPFFLDIAFVLFIVTEVTDIADGKLFRDAGKVRKRLVLR